MNLNFEHFEPVPGNFAGVNEGTPGFRRGEGAILGNTLISWYRVFWQLFSARSSSGGEGAYRGEQRDRQL